MNLWKRFYKEEYPKFWDKQAPKYAVDEGYRWYYEGILKEITRQKKSGIVLDCGSGTGEPLGVNLVKKNYNYFGIDISFELANQCKKKVQKNIVVGDLENLPFKSDYFDLVTAISTTWYIEDFERMIWEMYRICRKDGVIVFDVLNRMHVSEFIESRWGDFVRSRIGKFIRKIKRRLQGKKMDDFHTNQTSRIKIRRREEVERSLKRFDLSFKREGYYIFLPLSLPHIKDKLNFFYGGGVVSKLNVGRIFRKFRGFQLETFAAKLVYFCRKH